MRKQTLFLVTLAVSLLAFTSCGGGKSDNTTSKKAEIAQNSQPEKEMTIETACKLDNELATLLMQNYWDKFKGKDYKDIKDIYEQYLKEESAIYNKYGVSTDHHGFSVQSYQYWASDNRAEMKKYRKEHPEYDFYVKFPEFLEAKAKILNCATAKYSELHGN
ncbi:MAG TPA: hypothetical protein VMV56_12780 [Williamwhitmania sp.]|nr:hypothetical protein [Williamwhitmania sp.]